MKKIIVFLWMMLLIVIGNGCARGMYDGLRLQQEMKCDQLQGADPNDCAGRSGMSYDEYQRQLNEREKNK